MLSALLKSAEHPSNRPIGIDIGPKQKGKQAAAAMAP